MQELVFDATKIIKVPISQIKPNPWNPKKKDTEEFEKVKKSIVANGLRGYILVRQLAENSYEIIDGEQRYTAADQLDFTEMYVYNEGTVPEKKAIELTIWYQQQVPFDRVEEAYLVNKLVMEYKGDVALPYAEDELIEFKNIAEFDFDNYNGDQDPGEEIVTLTFHFDKKRGEEIMQTLKAEDANKDIALYNLVVGN